VYIFYVQYNNRTNFKSIKLTSDGLKIDDIGTTEIVLTNNFGTYVYTSWHLKHNNLDYLIFMESPSNPADLKVAKSVDGILGPYEVRSDVLIQGAYWEPSTVKDVSDNDTVLVVASYVPANIYVTNMKWVNDWPVVTDFRQN